MRFMWLKAKIELKRKSGKGTNKFHYVDLCKLFILVFQTNSIYHLYFIYNDILNFEIKIITFASTFRSDDDFPDGFLSPIFAFIILSDQKVEEKLDRFGLLTVTHTRGISF